MNRFIDCGNDTRADRISTQPASQASVLTVSLPWFRRTAWPLCLVGPSSQTPPPGEYAACGRPPGGSSPYRCGHARSADAASRGSEPYKIVTCVMFSTNTVRILI